MDDNENSQELEKTAEELYGVIQEIVKLMYKAGGDEAIPVIEDTLSSYIDAINFGRMLDFYQFTGNPLFMWEATRAYLLLSVGGRLIMPDDMKLFLVKSCDEILSAAKAQDISESLEISQKDIRNYRNFSNKLTIATKALKKRQQNKGKCEYPDMVIGEEYGISDRTVRQFIYETYTESKNKWGFFRAEKMTKAVLEAAKAHLAELKEEIRK